MNNIINYSNLLLQAVNVTEKAAIAAYSLIGQGREKDADRLATSAMRECLSNIEIDGTIVIGEGERDQAPMLYIGEKLGKGGDKIDIAVDPLEGTTLLAHNAPGALSVIGLARVGGFLHAPDIYMDKIATGIKSDERIIDLDNSPAENLKNIAIVKKCNIADLLVIILDRPRHEELVARARETGARIKLIDDGDIAAVIATSSAFHTADVYMGIGGAPEGVLSAAALQNSGGQMCARLIFTNQQEKRRAQVMGIKDFNRQYFLDDLAAKDAIFAATGVTEGELLCGVNIQNNIATTHSLLIYQGIIRKITTRLQLSNGSF